MSLPRSAGWCAAATAFFAGLLCPLLAQPFQRPGDGGDPKRAAIGRPSELAIDAAGNLYIYEDSGGSTAAIREIPAGGNTIKTLWTGCDEAPPGPEPEDCVSALSGMLALNDGRLLLVEFLRNRLRIFDPVSETFTLVAGNGTRNFSADGGLATLATVVDPRCITMDRDQNIFVCDYHDRIRRIDAKTGIITTAATAEFVSTMGIAADSQDHLFIADAAGYAGRIRRVNLRTGVSETIAGTGKESRFAPLDVANGPALKANLFEPMGLAFDSRGDLLFINSDGRICKIDLQTGSLTTVAGTGAPGYSGDGGPATKAKIFAAGIALDRSDNLLFADWGHNRIRRVDAVTGVITTVAGTGPKRRVSPRIP